MEKKKINPEDLKVTSKDITGNEKNVKGENNYEPNDPDSIVSTNVCHTMECATLLDECWPTWDCKTKVCHTNDGCIQTQSGHQECCPMTEEGPCPHTTDCMSVAQVCPSVDVCFETEKLCAQTNDCIAESLACEIATLADGSCGITSYGYEDGSCENPIQTVDYGCEVETSRCEN